MKEPHIHLYVSFGKSTCRPSTLAKKLLDDPCRVSYVKGCGIRAIEYLCHLNDPQKKQYDPDEVITIKGKKYAEVVSEFQKGASHSDALTTGFQQYCDKAITYAQMIKLLDEHRCPGKLWGMISSEVEKRRKREVQNLMSGGREMQVIFIVGKPGAGKSKYAEILAEHFIESGDARDYSRSSSSNDMLQDYMGEDIFILDDMRDRDEDTGKHIMSFADLLKFFDPHYVSSTKSRYQNKCFTGRYLIITTTEDPISWYSDTGEDRWQFFRRISKVIEVGDRIRWYYTQNFVGEYQAYVRDENGIITRAPLQEDEDNFVLDYINKTTKTQTSAPKVGHSVSDFMRKKMAAASV